MISEVDIRDWKDAALEGYTDFVAQSRGERVYGSEVFQAGAQWAFEFMLVKQKAARSAWRKRQLQEEAND